MINKNGIISVLLSVLFLFSSHAAAGEGLNQRKYGPNGPMDQNTVKISIPEDLNYYIETDSDERFGYDWEIDERFNEIKGASVSSTADGDVLTLPADRQHYIWLNTLIDDEYYYYFDTTVSTPVWTVELKDLYESYYHSNLVISPLEFLMETEDYAMESVEVMSFPDTLPEFRLSFESEYGACSFDISASFAEEPGDSDVLDSSANFLLFLDNEEGDLGIWITASDEEDISLFEGSEWAVSLSAECDGKYGPVSARTKSRTPIRMQENGILYFSYLGLQEGTRSVFEADLDGDDEFESNNAARYFDFD